METRHVLREEAIILHGGMFGKLVLAPLTRQLSTLDVGSRVEGEAKENHLKDAGPKPRCSRAN